MRRELVFSLEEPKELKFVLPKKKELTYSLTKRNLIYLFLSNIRECCLAMYKKYILQDRSNICLEALKAIFVRWEKAFKLIFNNPFDVACLKAFIVDIKGDYKLIFDNPNEIVCLKAPIIDIKEDDVLNYTIPEILVGLLRLLSFKVRQNEKVKDISTNNVKVLKLISITLNTLQQSIIATFENMCNMIPSLITSIDNVFKLTTIVDFGLDLKKSARVKSTNDEKLDYECSFNIECQGPSTRTFSELDEIILGDLDPLVLYQV